MTSFTAYKERILMEDARLEVDIQIEREKTKEALLRMRRRDARLAKWSRRIQRAVWITVATIAGVFLWAWLSQWLGWR